MDHLVSVLDSLINQLNADARGMEYLEGASNVQKMIIGKELSKLYRKENDHLTKGACSGFANLTD